MSTRNEDSAKIEQRVLDYFEACNSGDVTRIVECFTPDAVHYFPPGMYDGPWRGAEFIANKWNWAVETLGSYWTVDHVAIDTERNQAVAEWSHFKRKQGRVLRGDEWYVFDDRGRISEIRAYYASPEDAALDRVELGGFDYAARGYTIDAPQLPASDS